MVVFSVLLYSTMVGRNEEDKLVWLAACSGSFEVKSYYTVLLCRNSHSFPWKSIWKVKVPSKVAFFTWTATKGKILWCEHEVQAPNYTHVQEEKQKIDGPTCGLMDEAYQLLGLTLSKPKHLMIRVSLCIFIVSYLNTFLNLLNVTTSSSTIRIRLLNSLNFSIYSTTGAVPCFRRSHSSRRELL